MKFLYTMRDFLESNRRALTTLIDDGNYFGDKGALGFFSGVHMTKTKHELASGDVYAAMTYLNVVYSAMTYAAVSPSIVMKMRVIYLAFLANVWSARISAAIPRDCLTCSDVHVLMSVSARSLQILKRLRLHTVLSKLMSSLKDNVRSNFMHIYEQAERVRLAMPIPDLSTAAGREKYHESMYFNLSSERVLSLMAEALLIELDREGLYDFSCEGVVRNKLELADTASIVGACHAPDACSARERIFRYAAHHEYRTDRGTAQVVARLFRAIGHQQKAANVAANAGNQDQLVKAS